MMRRTTYGSVLRLAGLLALLCLAAGILSGCGSRDRSKVIAKAGSRVLTRDALSAIAGKSADSLSGDDRARLVQAWVERALVDQEGKRQGLEHDPLVANKLAAMRADLFMSRLLAKVPTKTPTDAQIKSYYDAHKPEFLRPVDSYLLEIYSARDQALISRFRDQLMRNDTSMVTAGDVSPEGKWLAESGDLDSDLERELASLRPGEVTFPRKYEDGYRVSKLIDVYPAGTVLDVSAVKDEILSRMLMEQSRARQDSVMVMLRERYPVKIFGGDSLK
jgi:hypothetical protein